MTRDRARRGAACRPCPGGGGSRSRLLYGRKIDRSAKARARIGLGDPGLRRRLFHHCGAARDVRGRIRRPHRAPRRDRRRDRDRASRYSRSQRRSARDRRTRAVALRRAAPADRRRRGGRTSHRRSARSRCRPNCASGCLPGAASSGSSATSRRSSSAKSIAKGCPGIGFLNENKRNYPNGAEVSHLIGHVNIDNQGIAGMEKWLDGHGLAALHMAGLATDRLQTPVELAVDLRVQHALRDELVAARAKFKALAAAGLVLDVRTGEIIAMVSEPDYDPNNPREALDPTRINPADHRRLRDGIDVQGFHHRDGARFRQGHAQIVIRRAHAAALRQVRHPRFRRRESRARPCRRFSPIRRTSARRALRSRSASRRTRRSCEKWVSSTGCAPNCRKAPSRSCPSAGANSTPSPSPSVTASRSRRCRR